MLTGAPSLAPASGAGATGLDDIAFIGNTAYGLIGFGADPNLRSTYNATTEPGAALLGQLVSLSLDGTNNITAVADVAGYERSANPDGGEFNSNPFGLTNLPDGTFAVTDAGGNSLLKATTGGTVSTLVAGAASVLGPKTNPLFGTVGGPTYQAVPTSVAVNPLNGNYYFTQLTGFPFVAGAANIYQYNPLSGTTSIAYTGFTNLIDLTFDPSGTLYALQYDTNGLASPSGPGSGQLIAINSLGVRNTILSTGLVFPTAVAYGPDGALYVASAGSGAGAGSVIRITSVAPEPGTLALLALGSLPLVGSIRRRAKSRA